MNADIVVVGSLNADFVINVERFPVPGETLVGRTFKVFPGGKGANQAYAAGKLGGRVSMVGRVGNDAQAEWLMENLRTAGVQTEQVTTDSGSASGIATITIDGSGQNEIIIVPGANGRFTPDGLERAREVIESARFMLLQLEIPLATVMAAARLAREAGATVILDPAPAVPLSDELLRCTDYLTPNESELAILSGEPPGRLTRVRARELASRLLSRGARKVLVKLGAEGALLVQPGAEQFWPAFPVAAVDTTAAGDAFNAAFAVALAAGESETQAGRFACAAAAVSVTRAGAQPSMPTAEESRELLRKNP